MDEQWERLLRAVARSASLKRTARDLHATAMDLRSVAAELSAEIQDQTARAAAFRRRRLSVLSIDDDADANEMVAATSGVLGLDATAATVTHQVTRILRESGPTVVLASLRFPAATDTVIRAATPVILTPTPLEWKAGLCATYSDTAKGLIVRPFDAYRLLDVIGTMAVVTLERCA